jgi:hypothetical protein
MMESAMPKAKKARAVGFNRIALEVGDGMPEVGDLNKLADRVDAVISRAKKDRA